jgi:hypothetical protein
MPRLSVGTTRTRLFAAGVITACLGMIVLASSRYAGALYLTPQPTASTPAPDELCDVSSADSVSSFLQNVLGVTPAYAADPVNLPGLADDLRKLAGEKWSTGPISGLPGGGTIPPSRRCARTVWELSGQYGINLPPDDLASDLCDDLASRPGATVGPIMGIDAPLPLLGPGDVSFICLSDGPGHVGHVAWIIGMPVTDPQGRVIGYVTGIVGNSQGYIQERDADYWKKHGYKNRRIITLH